MPEFDEKYVKELREENAKWRTKFRELEANELYKDVEVEFAKRGIAADPTWVQVEEGQSVTDAVEALVAKHPNLVSQSTQSTTQEVTEPTVRRPTAPRVMSPGGKHSDTPANPLHERSMTEIKKDPVARSRLRDLYRDLLASTSNQPNHGY